MPGSGIGRCDEAHTDNLELTRVAVATLESMKYTDVECIFLALELLDLATEHLAEGLKKQSPVTDLLTSRTAVAAAAYLLEGIQERANRTIS